MTHVPVVYTDLDGIDAARRMIGDNRLAALAEPDASALAELLRQLQAEDALGGTGYDDAAVAALLATVGVPDVAFKEYDESAADDVEYNECPACGHKWPK